MPGSQIVHLDQYLTNVAIGYSQPGLIAEQMAHVVPVKKQSDLYRIYDTEAMRPVNDLRAPKATPNKIDWTYSEDSYFCREHALRTEITPEELANADSDLDLFSDAAIRLKGKLQTGLEASMAAIVALATTYKAGVTRVVPAIKWDAANAVPAEDMSGVRQGIFDLCGRYPNTAVMGTAMREKLKANPAALGYFQYVSGGLLTDDQLKNLLGVDRVLIGPGQKITSKKGQVDTRASIWNDDRIMFLYVSPNLAATDDPSSLALFNWNAPHGGNRNISIEKWWNQDNKVWVVDAMWHWVIKELALLSNDLITGGIVYTVWT